MTGGQTALIKMVRLGNEPHIKIKIWLFARLDEYLSDERQTGVREGLTAGLSFERIPTLESSRKRG